MNKPDHNDANPLVGIIMGSTSDWETMEHASNILTGLNVPHETRVVSAHRTPDLLFEYAAIAEQRGLEVIIAGAGGAAHLPGMTASKTVLPVLGLYELLNTRAPGPFEERRVGRGEPEGVPLPSERPRGVDHGTDGRIQNASHRKAPRGCSE